MNFQLESAPLDAVLPWKHAGYSITTIASVLGVAVFAVRQHAMLVDPVSRTRFGSKRLPESWRFTPGTYCPELDALHIKVMAAWNQHQASQKPTL